MTVLTLRRVDAMIAHLYALGVLNGEDLTLLHNLPFVERVEYLRARCKHVIQQLRIIEIEAQGTIHYRKVRKR